MTSTTNPALASKAQQISSASQNAQSSVSNNDQQASSHHRSFSSSGSSGAAAAGSRNQANPRNIQTSKSKHKNHRRPSMQRDDVIAEAIAMTSSAAGRKGRTSITHLMDWTPPPRPQQHGHSHSRGSHHSRRTPSWGLGSGYHAIDKARYVNANYRFIVDPSGDYRAQSLDPDSHLPWTGILQILASSITQATSCPICLCDPVAPRMARCGHIFCFPCLIRYMASQDDTLKPGQPGYYHPTANANKQKWKKCPICHDTVYMNEVRPVKFYTGQEAPPPREGSDVMLRLMMREPGSTLSLPKDAANTALAAASLDKKGMQSEKEAIPWHYAAEVTDYARIMKGTQSYLKNEYEREISELEEQERLDELMFGDDTDSVRKAITKIRSAMEKIKDLPDKEEKSHDKILGRELYEQHLLETEKLRSLQRTREAPILQTEVEVPDMYLAISSSAQNGYAHHQLNEAKPEEPPTPTKALTVPKPPKPPTFQRSLQRAETGHDPTQPYFFYQSLPHSYLSPLDIRILKVAFGNFSSFPSSVLPRVENFSTGHVVDDDLRKRAKYLSHLPYGCEVAFLECDWTDIVPADVLDKFSADIERRRKRKREKDNREERDRLRAEREEDEKRWSAARRRKGGDDDMSVAMESSLREFSAQEEFEVVPEEEEELLGTSAPNTGPKFGFASLPQSSPPSSRTVWGTPIVAGEVEYKPPVEDKKIESSGWLEDWEKEAIAMDMGGGGDGGKAAGSKGKKKFKKVMLMTNTGKRGA